MAVVLDPTIISEINAGNEGIANQINDLRRREVPMHMTRELYNKLAVVEANVRLLRELGVIVPLSDGYAKNAVMQQKLRQMARGDLASAALVLHLSEKLRTDAQLMTTDKEAASQFQKYYGRVLLAMAGSRKNQGVDYNQSRRLLGLRPLVITANGKVVPAPNVRNGRTLTVRPNGSVAPRPKITPLPGGTPPPATIDGKPWSPRPEPSAARGGNPVSPKADQSVKVDSKTTPTRPVPAGSRPADGEGVKFVFQGVNYVIQGINDEVQKKRYEARWAQISAALFDRYRSNRRVDHHEKSVYCEGVIVKQFLKWAASRRMIVENPLSSTKLSKPTSEPKAGPSLDQINLVLTAFELHVMPLIAVLAFTGMRAGELHRLRDEDIDLAGNWIHIRSRPGAETKTRTSRKVPIHPRLREILSALPRRHKGWLFVSGASAKYPAGDHQINIKRLNEQFQRVVKRLGLPIGRDAGFTLHSLRHSFETITVNAGIPQRAIDNWLGHSSDKSMAAVYYRLSDEESQAFMLKVPFGTGLPAAEAGEESTK